MTREEEIQEAIQKEKQRLEKLIAATKENEENLGKRLIEKWNEREVALMELKQTIKSISKPFDEAISGLQDDNNKISSRRHEMERMLNTTDIRIRAGLH